MSPRRTRYVLFFILYALVLLLMLGWVHFSYVRERVGGDLTPAYALFGIAVVYLAVRAYLVFVRHISEAWESAWLTIDTLLITMAVAVTGRLSSDAALLYVWPLTTMAIQRRPRATVAVGAGILVLYTLVTAENAAETGMVMRLVARLCIIVAATAVAVTYAVTEAALLEELARLREQVALADYRSRLSHEMHDGIQHYLVRINTRLNLARAVMAKDPEKAARVAVDQAHSVQQASDELRYLVRRLRSPVVERHGFVEALKEHLESVRERSGAKTELTIEGNPRPCEPDVEQAAFRITQEALTNAEKHAEASQLKVRLVFGERELECSVADNGVGFEGGASGEDSFGLIGMRERAEAVGGEVEVITRAGEGTTVRFCAPLAEVDDTSEGRKADAGDPTAHR